MIKDIESAKSKIEGALAVCNEKLVRQDPSESHKRRRAKENRHKAMQRKQKRRELNIVYSDNDPESSSDIDDCHADISDREADGEYNDKDEDKTEEVDNERGDDVGDEGDHQGDINREETDVEVDEGEGQSRYLPDFGGTQRGN